MWLWMIISLLLLFIIVFEEAVYLVWNRYVFGPKEKRAFYRRIINGRFLRRILKEKEFHASSSDKSN